MAALVERPSTTGHLLGLPVGKRCVISLLRWPLTTRAEIRLAIYRHLLLPFPYAHLVSYLKISSTDRFLPILRVSRQIYVEASSVLYKELGIVVRPGDVLSLLDDPSGDIVDCNKKVWRHNPLYGTGVNDGSGKRIYAKPEMDGLVEPHVFARFRHVVFSMSLAFQETGCMPIHQ